MQGIKQKIYYLANQVGGIASIRIEFKFCSLILGVPILVVEE